MMNTFHLQILFHIHLFIYLNVLTLTYYLTITLIIIKNYNNFNKFLL